MVDSIGSGGIKTAFDAGIGAASDQLKNLDGAKDAIGDALKGGPLDGQKAEFMAAQKRESAQEQMLGSLQDISMDAKQGMSDALNNIGLDSVKPSPLDMLGQMFSSIFGGDKSESLDIGSQDISFDAKKNISADALNNLSMDAMKGGPMDMGAQDLSMDAKKDMSDSLNNIGLDSVKSSPLDMLGQMFSSIFGGDKSESLDIGSQDISFEPKKNMSDALNNVSMDAMKSGPLDAAKDAMPDSILGGPIEDAKSNFRGML